MLIDHLWREGVVMARRWWNRRRCPSAVVEAAPAPEETGPGTDSPQVVELIDLDQPPRKLVPLENLLPPQHLQGPPRPGS